MWCWLAVALAVDIEVEFGDDVATLLETANSGDRLLFWPDIFFIDRPITVTADLTLDSVFPGGPLLIFSPDTPLVSMGDLTIQSLSIDGATIVSYGDLSLRDVVLSGPGAGLTQYGGSLDLSDVRTYGIDTLVTARSEGFGSPMVTASLVQADQGAGYLFDVRDGTAILSDMSLSNRTGLLHLVSGDANVTGVNQQGGGDSAATLWVEQASLTLTGPGLHEQWSPWVDAQDSAVVVEGATVDGFYNPAAFFSTDSELTLVDLISGAGAQNLVRGQGGTLAVEGATLTGGYGYTGLFHLTGVDATFSAVEATDGYTSVIHAVGGSVEVSDSSFVGGFASAIDVMGGELVVRESVFTDNVSTAYGYYGYYGYYGLPGYYGGDMGGGGIRAVDSAVELTDLVLTGNVGEKGGGCCSPTRRAPPLGCGPATTWRWRGGGCSPRAR